METNNWNNKIWTKRTAISLKTENIVILRLIYSNWGCQRIYIQVNHYRKLVQAVVLMNLNKKRKMAMHTQKSIYFQEKMNKYYCDIKNIEHIHVHLITHTTLTVKSKQRPTWCMDPFTTSFTLLWPTPCSVEEKVINEQQVIYCILRKINKVCNDHKLRQHA